MGGNDASWMSGVDRESLIRRCSTAGALAQNSVFVDVDKEMPSMFASCVQARGET